MKNTNESMAQVSGQPQKPVKSGKNRIVKLLVVIVIILAGATIYFFQQYTNIKANPGQKAQAETNRLVGEVSRLLVLPQETPTVATITDIDKLKDQAFFANAKNGDKVLIFTGAKKAVLYDPVAKKIIEVAPINIGDNTSSKSSRSSVSVPSTTTPTTSTTSEASSGTTTGN